MLNLIPHLQQYDGAWSIYGPSAANFWMAVRELDWTAHRAEVQSRIDEGEYAYSGQGFEVTPEGIAVVDLEGVLTKYGSSLSMGGSTVRFRQVLRNVERSYRSGDVKACMLCIESGGGSTMGTPEAAAEVKKLASVLPVWTFFEDIGASAAYWIGSQATRVLANASALIGSIGTYFVVDDVSAMFSEKGIKTNLFTTGKHKGAGTPGTEISEEQAAEFQSLVQRINAPFPEAIAKARGLSSEQINEVNDGRVWRGSEAVAKGLIDAVMSYDEALEELASQIATSTQGDRPMSTAKPKASSRQSASAAKSEEDKKTETEVEVEDEKKDEQDTETMDEKKDEETSSASSAIAAIEKAVPKADSAFVLKAVKQGMTPDQARTAWLEQTVESQAKQIETLESQSPKPGSAPLGTGKQSSGFSGDAKAAWKAAIKSKTDEGMTKAQAVSVVTREQPELHSAYVAACNAR